MDSFNDYYNILGVEVDAPPQEIKAAFKKLALQYHPDVYKGEDAHERMRLILKAYQTLNNPEKRRQYDAARSEHVAGDETYTSYVAPTGKAPADVSRGARRDRERHYDFPDFPDGQPVRINLVDMTYTLSPDEARALRQDGMWRGVAPETKAHAFYCHRCHYRWQTTAGLQRSGRSRVLPRFCPKCLSMDWSEYLLLRCVHCCAVFESEQIRYEIGTYSYGKRDAEDDEMSALCPPYELFPLCPYCGTARWCPAEDERVDAIRVRAARRVAALRLILVGVAVAVMLLAGVIAFNVLR